MPWLFFNLWTKNLSKTRRRQDIFILYSMDRGRANTTQAVQVGNILHGRACQRRNVADGTDRKQPLCLSMSRLGGWPVRALAPDLDPVESVDQPSAGVNSREAWTPERRAATSGHTWEHREENKELAANERPRLCAACCPPAKPLTVALAPEDMHGSSVKSVWASAGDAGRDAHPCSTVNN